MKLEQAIDNLIYLERYVNTRKYADYAAFSDVSREYHPVEGSESFNLGYIDLDPDEITVLKANPDTELNIKPNRFYVHPDMINEYSEIPEFKTLARQNGNVKVTPTSSTRTVMPIGENYYIKVNLNKRISRYIRRLRKNSVEHSIKISNEMEEASRNAPEEFAYLPESYGMIYNGIGQIIREATPRPIAEDDRFMIPYFSLHSRDLKNPKDDPLLVQLINRSGSKPADYFLDKIINPLISCWSWMAQERGVLLESHSQNTLLELDYNFEPRRVVHRDFQSLMVNTELRREKGLENCFNKHILGQEDGIAIKQNYSFVFDWFIGHYLLDKMVGCMDRHYSINPEDIKDGVKDVFNHHFKNQKLYFSKEVYGFVKSPLKDNMTVIEVKKECADYR
ncbi:MAG: hypothetical protein KJ583_07140 [Nanoarchaeota archaeon]|nr:hypothetical protein [Nanoarchaeota archaeon]MBU1269603.1 hypothetical protein [Nanoarchaeota archaeon]MBU1605061.1 hypothetical protein [Nanoarchaeota archaeon]MBU2442615.1 hypothetical protein [Nanoarchaeota archaeon]